MSDIRGILRNHMKEKLARDQVVASMTVRLCRSIEIAQIAATAGFDTLYVDLEHNTLSIDTCCQICIAAQQIGLTPLVRVPANSAEYICRVLDGGAMGPGSAPGSRTPTRWPRPAPWSIWSNSRPSANARLAALCRTTSIAVLQ